MVFLYIPFLFSWPSHFFTWQINERSVGKTSRDSYEENYILDPPFSPSCISHHVTGFCKSTQLRALDRARNFPSRPFCYVDTIHYSVQAGGVFYKCICVCKLNSKIRLSQKPR